MTNHPRRAARLERKRAAAIGRRVARWVTRTRIAVLEPWQEEMMRRAYAGGDPGLAIGTDVAADGTTTVVGAMNVGGKVWIAPVGTEPPTSDPRPWLLAGSTVDTSSITLDEPVDWSGTIDTWADPETDVRGALAAHQRLVAALTTATITVPTTITTGVVPIRGFDDNITGRVWEDGLHPGNTLEWLTVVEGRGPDGNPLRVCDHCGEPTPCTEKVLRHMDTDMHHAFCVATGFCVIAERRVRDLPAR